MSHKNLERKISIIMELAQTSAWLNSVMQIGPLIAMQAAMKRDISILEDFKREIKEKHERFEELQAEWQTMDLLEDAGLEVQN